MINRNWKILAGLVLAWFLLSTLAQAQITTGTVTGRVVDPTGAVVPGARVVLISETKGTRTAPVFTNDTGDYVIPYVTPDTYTVEITASSFKTTQRTGVVVTGGDRVGVPPITLELGQTVETITVSAQAELIQTQSGERSYAIETKQIESLPINRTNFTSLVAFTPGVIEGGASAGGTRLGGASQNNIMMDGVSAMDTGNNGQMLAMNIESIGEVKVLTQGYQAEYGRSSGLQITAVTKSGTNELHGSAYGVFTDSDWNNRTWVQQKNNDPKPKTDQQIWGYTIGGPVVIPKIINGRNKLFFFYAHEYRPTTTAINSGNVIRFRLPTAAERAGDFSQSRDQNGNLITAIKDHAAGGAPFPGNIIPAARLYAPGVAVLNRYPLPNVEQKPGMNYNYEVNPPSYNDLLQQPAFRIDYQVSSNLRLIGKYSGQRQRKVIRPGMIQGFTDVYTPRPFIHNPVLTVNYTFNPTTFMEATYGGIQNELAGGNEGGILVNPESNRLKSLADFPLLYPDAGVMDTRYYGYKIMQEEKPPFWDGKKLNLPPTFGWGSRITAGPPQQRYPGWLNKNRTQDFSTSVTKVMARHTIKGGFYLNHSFKAQNVGAGGIANLTFQGYVNFGDDTNNTLDSGFGYSNAALGVFTQYLQQSKFIEGNLVYNQIEWYIQDNWKATNRLTLDYGMRFVNQQPQYDKFLQMSNFFPDLWKKSDAPVFYVAGCKSGATVCSGNDRNAMDPRTGQILTAVGAANTQAAIATPIPGTGNWLNGVRKAGEGIAKTNYTWPTLVLGPRFGFAYDITGRSNWVLRGGIGMFYDRPDGNTTFSTPGNPPTATAKDLRNGLLSTLGQGLSPQPVPTLITFQYKAKVPASLQWNIGIQKSLPFSMVGDISYVGNHGYNRLGAFQGAWRQDLNAVDIGTAYLPEYQDPTLGTSTIPGKTAYPTNLLRPFRGFAGIEENQTEFWDEYHSIQMNLNRRFRNGISFGANYTYGISLKGNTGINRRFQHSADGKISLRADQKQYEKLMETLDVRPHLFKAYGIWDSPGISGKGRLVRELTRDWQLSTVITVASGAAYDLGYTYQTDGANVNITGSPNWAGRVILLPGLGTGCSDNQYAQFNASAVKGPGYYSVGMESGRNYLRGCLLKNVDLSLVRRIRFFGLGEKYRLELRANAFNAFNLVSINSRVTQAQFNNPTSMTLVNNQYNADGTLNQNRLTPRNAGFGAANGAQAMRTIELQLRFQF